MNVMIWIMVVIMSGGLVVPDSDVTGKTVSECLVNASKQVITKHLDIVDPDGESPIRSVLCTQIPQKVFDELKKKQQEKVKHD